MNEAEILLRLRKATLAESQMTVSRQTHVSQPTINQYVNGVRKVGDMAVKTFLRLAPALGLKIIASDTPGEIADSPGRYLPDHPCDHAPPWLADVCRQWDSIDRDHQAAVRIAAQAALGGSGHATNHSPKTKAG